MASLAMVMGVVEEASKHLPLHKVISGIFGSISMAAWMCVILPQMVVNYRAKSAEALSMPFLIVWMLGDTTNLLGGLLTHLAPTAVALAMYFCIADVFLVSQCVYYNTVNARRAAAQLNNVEVAEATEDAPLLARRNTSPSRHRRDSTSKIAPAGDDMPEGKPWVYNALSLLAVYVVGFMGWFISYKAGAWRDAERDVTGQGDAETAFEGIGMVLGYISAVCYLCARIPQIIKNYKEKSCEGLAILFFMLSLTGNLTYSISVIAYSQEKKYLINTIPWLIGSLGTIAEDCIIFVQFRLYANNKRSDSITQA